MEITIKTFKDVINVEVFNVIAELQPETKLCTIYKPHTVMGERLGCFLYENYTLTEFLDKVKSMI